MLSELRGKRHGCVHRAVSFVPNAGNGGNVLPRTPARRPAHGQARPLGGVPALRGRRYALDVPAGLVGFADLARNGEIAGHVDVAMSTWPRLTGAAGALKDRATAANGAGIEREAERRRGPGPSLPWSARAGSDRMNKSEMVNRVAGEAQVTRDAAEAAVGAVFSAVGEALARGEPVAIMGFGTFTRKSRPAPRGPERRAPASASPSERRARCPSRPARPSGRR